ncbi:N-acetylglucosamine-6-phosphate deacetylase [Halosimplex aquaticum]|uniref:N-acetylglucosamine-6-phosphate deacetylase n=1 Tax=Halosimplex aquaticum TaxID=3026162 RepID=A0ABD5Y720_9EURY|nr:N-acetylglucosamine-6-phosphate deacetylase [Halosimplex aquaticum]
MSGTIDVYAGTVLTPGETYSGAVISVVDGRIDGINESPERSADLSFPDGIAIPGLIDVHTHGFGGHCATSGHASDVAEIAESAPSHGVTTVFPTTMSATHGRLLDAASAFAAARARAAGGADLPGLHLEGPYFTDDGHSGVQDPDTFREPSVDELDELLDAADGGIARVTLAPELDGALEFVRAAKRRGLVVSAAHSDAGYERTRTAFDSGVSLVAHLYNGMAQFHHRRPGLVGGALVADGVAVELIADGVHLHPAAVELAIRAKGVENVLLVSDSAPYAGCPDGEYEIGGRRVVVSDGACRADDGETLAGSALTLDGAVRTVVDETSVDLADAVAMATANPARELSLLDRGRLATGYRGDIAVLDGDLDVVATVVEGTVQYRR